MLHVQHSQRKEETSHVDDRCKVVLFYKEDSEYFAQEEKGKYGIEPMNEIIAKSRICPSPSPNVCMSLERYSPLSLSLNLGWSVVGFGN